MGQHVMRNAECGILRGIKCVVEYKYRFVYLLRNLLTIMRLAVVKSLSLKSANSAICHIDAEFSGIKCGIIPHRYSAFYTSFKFKNTSSFGVVF